MGSVWAGSLPRKRRRKGLGYICPVSPGWFGWNKGGVRLVLLPDPLLKMNRCGLSTT